MATSLALDTPDKVTLGASNIATRLDLPTNAREIEIRPVANDVYYTYTGVNDGASAAAVDGIQITANTTRLIAVPGTNGRARNLDARAGDANSRKLLVWSATGSTEIQIVVRA